VCGQAFVDAIVQKVSKTRAPAKQSKNWGDSTEKEECASHLTDWLTTTTRYYADILQVRGAAAAAAAGAPGELLCAGHLLGWYLPAEFSGWSADDQHHIGCVHRHPSRQCGDGTRPALPSGMLTFFLFFLFSSCLFFVVYQFTAFCVSATSSAAIVSRCSLRRTTGGHPSMDRSATAA
jgi:hypothetical protein